MPDEREPEPEPSERRAPARRLGELPRGVLRCALLGVCAGALEMAWQGLAVKAPLGVGGWVQLSLAVALADAAWFGLLGLAGAVLLLRPNADRALPAAHQLALTAFLGVATLLFPAIRELVQRGNQAGSVIFGALPAVALLFTYFASRYLLRRSARGEGTFPFAPVAVGAWLAASVLAPVLVVLRAPIADPLDARHLVLITVDGLGAGQEGPAWNTFAGEGARFTQAVAASPLSRPSNASALVGLHPIRSHVVSDRDSLALGYTSAFEELRDVGFATGAFVSSPSVATGSGLDQGFGTYDDAFLPAALRSALLGRLVEPSGSRSAADTEAAFERWAEGRVHRPFAVWLHFSDPARAPGDPGALRAVDEAIGRVRALLEREGVLDRAAVVLVGTGGTGGTSALPGIGEDRVHVPLALRLPERLQVPVVDAQVRVVDVASTLLDAVELPALDQSEGVALVAYGTGLRKASMNATLLGVDDDGRRILGLRNNGLKFALMPDGGARLHDLSADPREERDIGAEQANTVKEATLLLSREKAALDALGRG